MISRRFFLALGQERHIEATDEQRTVLWQSLYLALCWEIAAVPRVVLGNVRLEMFDALAFVR